MRELTQVAAVFIVSPTYEGACVDVASAAEACHGAGVPLVVDEAHGAHLAFLGPPEEMSGQGEKETKNGESSSFPTGEGSRVRDRHRHRHRRRRQTDREGQRERDRERGCLLKCHR